MRSGSTVDGGIGVGAAGEPRSASTPTAFGREAIPTVKSLAGLCLYLFSLKVRPSGIVAAAAGNVKMFMFTNSCLADLQYVQSEKLLLASIVSVRSGSEGAA
ncbi:hypothetical protein PVAP13_8NG240801 [Panicum virgatum]|uniref:Uncharacterized protein n=1 Tax=Panicum virgatum TaxID=38727 RepID=A0A8T0P9J8_PANVG|nr:hypothetical protein PVAP13_8NG240801 [Panicum virgatum]